MRSILFIASGLGLLVSMTGCADLLGIEAWQDPANADGSGNNGAGAKGEGDSGAGGEGGEGGEGAAEPCSNGVQDGDEADVDCGGTACGACPDGAACASDQDCVSVFCSVRQLCAPVDGRITCGEEGEHGPSCGDCIKNSDETDIDCGGDACNPCRQGKACLQDADCLGGVCVANVCALGAPGVDCYANADCVSGQCLGADLLGGACQ
ncbi:hypothetical protein [Polyangium mundeleinium]|uniref:Tryptophan synthase alpha chain n=1 Tax=Polyangium mundeleinium TaxID=2995306 RepID=A0ABT5EX26_9BACT|nr:hypothetical protein [Polyangium mundeleinium]MDC0746374.1 hypothetical protein [Polyangium mundeleinium]